MNVHFTARHAAIPPDLKTYAEKRLAGLARFLDRATEADVVLSAEKSRQRVEIQVRGKQAGSASRGRRPRRGCGDERSLPRPSRRQAEKRSGRNLRKKNAGAGAKPPPPRPWKPPPGFRRVSSGPIISPGNRCPSAMPSSNSTSGKKRF